MADVMNYKCPCCGAPLVYKGDKQMMVCESCDNQFTMDQVREAEEAEKKSSSSSDMTWETSEPAEIKDENGNLKGYTCPSCGAEIVADDKTAATECPYCGNQAIVPNAFEGIYKPDCMIPFKVDKTSAEGALENFYKGKRLLPDEFSKGNRIKKISGVYVPFWLFDCSAEGNITYDGVKEKRWSDDKADYVKKDTYLVTRQGSMEFEKIPVDASSQMDDAYMDAIEPFDYSQAVGYDSAYFSGYLADKYDVDQAASIPRANERVTNSVKATLRDTVEGYDSVSERSSNVNIKKGKSLYAMMPVWMLNTKYQGKIYTFAMNGQSGKVVGSLPVDMGKFYKYLIGITLAALAVLQLGLIFVSGSDTPVSTYEIIAFIISIIIGLVSVFSMKAAMNTAVKQTEAGHYVRDGSFNLSVKRDVFMFTRTERTQKAEQDKGGNPPPKN